MPLTGYMNFRSLKSTVKLAKVADQKMLVYGMAVLLVKLEFCGFCVNDLIARLPCSEN